MATPSRPRLTVVLLTWNEERNVRASLTSLAQQREQDFEVIVLDAASTDSTAAIVAEVAKDFPVPLRVEVAERRISIGEARNRGTVLAKAPIVAFLSADAEADPRWAEELLHSMRSADLVFGRQVHAPSQRGVAAAVRGLRYHFPDGPTSDPGRYASNVNAGYRREILRAFPFGTSPGASAVDDLLLTQKALEAGYHAAYNPEMLVRHRDVGTVDAELAKNLREGLGWGEHARELGLNVPVLGWGAAVGFALLLFSLTPGLGTLGVVAALLWLPAARRAWRRRRRMGLRDLLLGAAASPPFDLAFLLAYTRGLLRGGRTNGAGTRDAGLGKEVES